MPLTIERELQMCGKQEAVLDLGGSELLLDAAECSFLSCKPEDPLFNLEVMDFNNHRACRGSCFGLGGQ